jgi:hypothetical protein
MTTTTRPIVRIHDLSNDKVIDREMTEGEFAQYQADAAAQAEAQTQAEAKATARAAILDRLGISAEEAALLLS